MSKHIPDAGSRFDAARGYTSLDGNGQPIWDIHRSGARTTFTHRKTGKQTSYVPEKKDEVVIISPETGSEE